MSRATYLPYQRYGDGVETRYGVQARSRMLDVFRLVKELLFVCT